MKKIIALVIAISCIIALVSCGGTNEVDTVGQMFKDSKPTKTVVGTTQMFGETTLEGNYTLVTGLVDGAYASVYEAIYDELLSVEEGATEEIQGSIVEKYELLEYLAGYGVRETIGKTVGEWDKEGEDFAAESGPVSLKLASNLVKTYVYENNQLRCIVPAANTAEVLGLEENLAVDATIEVTDDGASITSVIISYTLPEDVEAEVPETEVVIKAFYYYDLQEIIIDVE